MPLPLARMMAVGPDLTNPTIIVTAPAGGSYQTRTINLQANASDDRGVVGVQWQVDGVNVGAEVTSGNPWTLAFDTSTLSDGDHTIQAVARDAAGHRTTSLPVTIHVANPDTTLIRNWHTYNGIGSGSRNTYGSVGSFASPNFTNGSYSNWPGNPYANWGYILQVRIQWNFDAWGHGFESLQGINGSHSAGFAIGSTQAGATLLDNTSGRTTAWTTISDTLTGVTNVRDWCNQSGGVGGQAFVGDMTVQYRYQ